MRISKKHLYLFFILMIFCYGFMPLLIGDTLKNVIMMIIPAIIIFNLKNIKRQDLAFLSIFSLYIIYLVIQTSSSKLISSFVSIYRLYLFFPSITVALLLIKRKFSFKDIKLFQFVLKFLFYLGIVIYVLALYELINRTYIVNTIDINRMLLTYDGNLIRARVFSSSYLTLGDLFGILSLTSLLLYSIYKKKIYFIFIFIFLTGIFFASARGSIVGVFCAYAIYLIQTHKFHKKIKKKNLLIIFGSILAVIIVFMILKDNSVVQYMASRVENIFNWSTEGSNLKRIYIWTNYIKYWTSSPARFLFGSGGLTAGYESSMGVTESGLLEHLVEIGLLGSMMYYTLLLWPIVICAKTKQKDYLSKWALSCFTVIFVHDIALQVTASDEFCLLLWTFSGLLFMFHHIQHNNKDFEPKVIN